MSAQPANDRTDHAKIYTWTKRNGEDQLATTWFATVFEARQSRAKALGVPVHQVMGCKAGGR